MSTRGAGFSKEDPTHGYLMGVRPCLKITEPVFFHRRGICFVIFCEHLVYLVVAMSVFLVHLILTVV